ncbi:hypothetical protein [Kribbella qitaiheensis]|uniref:hypothetical protein n=1 Tax=Kribbella qitaiheensis TaxID=1544730 RepID=UPI0019D6276F|nr:hypothetical protein [Kribbella qitaiheensis]
MGSLLLDIDHEHVHDHPGERELVVTVSVVDAQLQRLGQALERERGEVAEQPHGLSGQRRTHGLGLAGEPSLEIIERGRRLEPEPERVRVVCVGQCREELVGAGARQEPLRGGDHVLAGRVDDCAARGGQLVRPTGLGGEQLAHRQGRALVVADQGLAEQFLHDLLGRRLDCAGQTGHEQLLDTRTDVVAVRIRDARRSTGVERRPQRIHNDGPDRRQRIVYALARDRVDRVKHGRLLIGDGDRHSCASLLSGVG